MCVYWSPVVVLLLYLPAGGRRSVFGRKRVCFKRERKNEGKNEKSEKDEKSEKSEKR